MNKRQISKIISLYRDGLSPEICISVLLGIMEKHSTNMDKAISIHAFYKEVFNLEVKQIKKEKI